MAEYLLYMWQIEDIIRAYRLDIDAIEKNIISQYQVDEETHKQIRDWWESLIKMMELENVRESGHLPINKERNHTPHRPSLATGEEREVSRLWSRITTALYPTS